MKIDKDILEILSRAETKGKELLLVGQLDRKTYMRTNKVLEAAGGRWNQKAKVHLFDYNAEERIDEIILSEEVEIPKDEFDFFPTPPEVVGRLINLANLESGMSLLEPSAGNGSIALVCAERGAVVDCCELMEGNAAILTQSSRFRSVHRGDFLLKRPMPIYDRIVMNPPFKKQADIKHVVHAMGFLKPDGLLVSVMSAGVTFRNNKLTTDFRDLIDRKRGRIERLPKGSFKDSGTMINTIIAIIPNGEC